MMAVPNTPKTPVVAMVGGGQLARMTHQAAIALGLRMLARLGMVPLLWPAASVFSSGCRTGEHGGGTIASD